MTTYHLRPSLFLCIASGLLLLPASLSPQSTSPSLVPGQTMTTLSDGRSLILGGWGPRGATETSVIHDPRSNTTTALAPLNPARAWHSATVLPDGTVLILGGMGSNSQPMAEPQILDPEDGTARPLSIPGTTLGPTTPRLCSPTGAFSSPVATTHQGRRPRRPTCGHHRPGRWIRRRWRRAPGALDTLRPS
jgi:hypothetical protein